MRVPVRVSVNKLNFVPERIMPGLMKTCSVRSKRRDQYQSDNPETNDKTKPFTHIIHDD